MSTCCTGSAAVVVAAVVELVDELVATTAHTATTTAWWLGVMFVLRCVCVWRNASTERMYGSRTASHNNNSQVTLSHTHKILLVALSYSTASSLSLCVRSDGFATR